MQSNVIRTGINVFRACCVGVCFLGCAVSEYDAEYARSVQAFREASQFAWFQRDSTVLTPEMSVRLPEGFAKVPDHPAVLRPSEVPGYVGTFARTVAIEGRQSLVPLVVAMPTNPKTVDIEEAITVKAKQTPEFASQPVRWETREISPLSGGPSVWRVLSFRGSIPFLTEDKQDWNFVKSAGLWEYWLSADREQKTCILFSWQLPDAADEAVGIPMGALPAILVRTVSRRAEPQDAAPEATAVESNSEQ